MELMKVMSEVRFLAGEDARGVLVVLEPETALTDERLAALADCGAAGAHCRTVGTGGTMAADVNQKT